MIKSFKAIGLQQQQQDSNYGNPKGGAQSLSKLKKNDGAEKGYQEDPLSELSMNRAEYRDLVQEIAGTIVGEYYQDKKGFAQNKGLVKEVQDDLIALGYNLGKSGADGQLGAKTIQAFHNFEFDHQKEIKEAATIQKAIPKGFQR